jgi:hypothetical protein
MLFSHELIHTIITAAAPMQRPEQQNSAAPLQYRANAPGFTLPVRLTSAMPVQRGSSSVPQKQSPHYSSQESVSSVEAGQVRAAQQRRRARRSAAATAATHASNRVHDYTRGLSSRSTSSGGSVCSSVGSSSSSSRTSVRKAGVAASVSSLEAGEQRVLRSQELEPGEIRR